MSAQEGFQAEVAVEVTFTGRAIVLDGDDAAFRDAYRRAAEAAARKALAMAGMRVESEARVNGTDRLTLTVRRP